MTNAAPRMNLNPKNLNSRQPRYTLEQISHYTNYLDTAHSEPLYRALNNPTSFNCVVNDHTNEAVCTTSQMYSIIQHKQAIDTVLLGLQGEGIEAKGIIKDYGNVAVLELLFDNAVKANDNQPVTMGIRFVNSFNKSTGFSGGAYAWRQICSNGMHAMALLRNTNIYFKHIGEAELRMEKAIGKFMNNLTRNEELLVSFINTALDTPVRFKDNAEKIATIAAYVGSERRAKSVIEVTGIPNDTDVYSLYNAITDYASHQEMSYSMVNTLQQGAQHLLSNARDFSVIEAVPVST